MQEPSWLAALIAYCVHQAVISQLGLAACDWHKISALALVLIGIRVARGIDDRLGHTLRRLCVTGAITSSEDKLRQLHERLALLRRRWAPVSGIVIGFAIALVFARGWEWKVIEDPWRLALLAIEAPIFYAAGYYIGWMVVQGGLARMLRTLGIGYSVQSGHPDGGAGLKPLGDFFFHQALVAGMPAAYVALWIALHNPLEFSWTMLVGFMVVEMVAFLWPMWMFHRVMLHQKRSLTTEADKIARRISSARAELRSLADPARVRELNVRLTLDQSLYEELQGLPTWPVSNEIRRRFALQNFILVAIPVLSLVIGSRTTLLEVLKAFFGGGG